MPPEALTVFAQAVMVLPALARVEASAPEQLQIAPSLIGAPETLPDEPLDVLAVLAVLAVVAGDEALDELDFELEPHALRPIAASTVARTTHLRDNSLSSC
jgi:hypothetical protein